METYPAQSKYCQLLSAPVLLFQVHLMDADKKAAHEKKFGHPLLAARSIQQTLLHAHAIVRHPSTQF